MNEKMFNEGNQIHNVMASSGFGTVINYGSGSDFLTSYGSGSTSQKVTVPTVRVPQHCQKGRTTNFLHSSLLLLFLDPGSGMCKNQDPA